MTPDTAAQATASMMNIEIRDVFFLTHATARLVGRVEGGPVDRIELAIDDRLTVPVDFTAEEGGYAFVRDIFFDPTFFARTDCRLSVTAHAGAAGSVTAGLTADLATMRSTEFCRRQQLKPVGNLATRYNWPDNLEPGLTTVVLGVYNGGKYLSQAIESVLSQSLTHFQFIIVDDASTDNTRETLQKYQAQDPRIELVLKDANEGQGAAFNSGIERARGDLIATLDADDYWFCDKLKRVRALFDEDPRADIYTIYQHRLNVCAGETLTEQPFRPSLIEGDVLNHCLREKVHIPGPFSPTAGLAFPTEILRAVYPIPREYRICADGFLTRAATTLGQSRVISDALGAYRIHADNHTVENESFDQQDYIHHLLKPGVNRFYQQSAIAAHIPILGRSTRDIPLNRLKRLREDDRVFYMPTRHKPARSLEDFKDRHKGERAFIVATGPSLKTEDLALLKDEITFSCNKITLAFDETGWQPTYYSIIDSMVYESFDYDWSKLKSTKFFPDDLRSKYASMRDAFFVRNRTPVYDGEERVFEFSRDISENIAGGFTVVYFLMQLAYYMGIEELYLIGLDFSFSFNKVSDETSAKGEAIIVNKDEVNHFHKDYRPEGQKWTMPRLDLQEKAFKVAKQAFEADGRRIYNASRTSALELFERVEFDQLIASGAHREAPSHDIYGAILHAAFNKTSGRLEVKGWAAPAPATITVFHRSVEICTGSTSPAGHANAAIASTNGIHVWQAESEGSDIQSGDYLRVELAFADGARVFLSTQVTTYRFDWEWQDIQAERLAAGSIDRQILIGN